MFLFAVVDCSYDIETTIASIEYSGVTSMDLKVWNGFTPLVVKEGHLVFESNSLCE